MKAPPFYDIIGAVVTLVLLVAVIAYPLCGHDIPQAILTPFSIAMGWVFRGATAIGNDYLHRKESTNEP